MPRALRLLGTTLAVLFLGIVVWRGVGAMPPVDFTSPLMIRGLFAALALYIASQLIATLAWIATLRAWSIKLPPIRTACQLLLSQLGKYIPGNVAQFVGRFALAKADGIPGTVVGAAILAETGLLIASGILIVSGISVLNPNLFAVLLAPVRSNSAGEMVWLVPALGLVAIIVAVALVQREIKRRDVAPFNLSWLGLPVLVHMTNFGVLGASLWFVTHAVAPEAQINFAYATTVFVVAWVAGFVVPGAPGGAGIREGILSIGLGLVIGDGAGLTVALMHRGISVLGDAATFGIGWLLRRQA